MTAAWTNGLTAALLILTVQAPALTAQGGADLVTRGVQAYEELDLDAAVKLLRRALTPPFADSLADGERVRALAYLGAAERFRQRLDSATAAFHRLLVLDPRYQLDSLVFPPEVTRLFDSVRANTSAVAIRVAAETALPLEGKDSVAVAVPAPTRRQGRALRVGTGVVAVWANSQVNGGRVGAAGTVGGAFASACFGRWEVDVQYLEGALQPRDASSARREFVQGRFGLAAYAAPWLAVHTALRARTYITSAVTERWVAWYVGARIERPIAGPAVRGHVEFWRALASGVNVGSDGGRGSRGSDAGVTLLLPGRPWWLRLAYAIDRSSVAEAGRRETVEEVTLTVGVRR